MSFMVQGIGSLQTQARQSMVRSKYATLVSRCCCSSFAGSWYWYSEKAKFASKVCKARGVDMMPRRVSKDMGFAISRGATPTFCPDRVALLKSSNFFVLCPRPSPTSFYLCTSHLAWSDFNNVSELQVSTEI